jgi:hypothetical protein
LGLKLRISGTRFRVYDKGSGFREGLVLKAHILLYHSTLGSRVMKKKEEFRVLGFKFRVSGFGFRVSGFRLRVSGFGFRILDFGIRASGSG